MAGLRSALGSRSTGDLLVLLIAGTVCFAVAISVISVVILQFTQPENKGGFVAVSDVINSLISLMAGFLAGRTDATVTAAKVRETGLEHSGDVTVVDGESL